MRQKLNVLEAVHTVTSGEKQKTSHRQMNRCRGGSVTISGLFVASGHGRLAWIGGPMNSVFYQKFVTLKLNSTQIMQQDKTNQV